MDAAGRRHLVATASVEVDGHVRVAASVPVDGARLSGADKARAPANWSPLAPPVSVWVSLDPVSVPGARRPTGHPRCLRVCRLASVCPWRAPLPAGARLSKPPGQLVTLPPARRIAAPTRPANWPRARLRLLLLLLALLALLALPSSPSRARLSARLEGAPTGPQPPQPTSLNRDPRAPPAALLLHIPTDLARPIIVRATVPGSERLPGRPTCAGRPRAARAARPPSQSGLPFVTRRRRRAGPRGHLGRPTGESSWRRSRGTGRCPPASPEKGVWAQLPGAAGPVDGRCLPTNLAKDRADVEATRSNKAT
ncbi:hypothetical protein V6Z77_010178 [Aspergillus fumigatus]